MAALDETQNGMLVTFYSALSCIYFPIIISILYFTDYLYIIGKNSFLPILCLFAVAECIKYLVGNYRFVRKDLPIGRRQDDRHGKKGSIRNRVREFFKSGATLVAMSAVYFSIAILFGAEAFSKHEETYMLSLLLCVLTIFPACLNVGAHSVLSLLLGIRPTPDLLGVMLVRNMQFTLFGTWLGAFVIPLDWDRPWQAWPVPCSVGALLGHTASNLIMLITMVPKLSTTYSRTVKLGRKDWVRGPVGWVFDMPALEDIYYKKPYRPP